MGCVFSSQSALTTAVQREIQVPCDTVWEVVSDINAIPSTVPHVEQIEFIGSKTDFSIGTKWRETRRVGKDVVPQVKTIINIQKDEYPRSISLSVCFPKGEEGTEDVENTCTFTVQPISEAESVLICSIAFASREGTERCCSRILLRYAEKYLHEELAGYAEAAEKRQRGETSGQ
mmetsp:Transcript_6127/g.13366  ORF Transcript_6127/g.13366 Transcript_6127/m.13366 type:complete len:175 (+) Transcript_6127:214-738(+)